MKTRFNFIIKDFAFALLMLSTTVAYSQCIVIHTTANPLSTNNISGPYVYGQSFTAVCSGDLEYFELTSTSTGTVTTETLNIYNGNTVSGIPIYTQIYPDITVATIGDPIRFDITGAVPLVMNDQYTFVFSINIVDIEFENNGAYLGGHSWQNGDPLTNTNMLFSASILDPVGINDITNNPDRELVGIVDLLGRETSFKYNTTLIYIYSDGTTERIFKQR